MENLQIIRYFNTLIQNQDSANFESTCKELGISEIKGLEILDKMYGSGKDSWKNIFSFFGIQ